MLIATLVCMILANAVCAIVGLFVKTNKTASFLLQTFALICLVCAGISGIFISNNLGYGMILIVSILPQFASIFDLKNHLQNIKTEKIQSKTFQKFVQSDGTLIESCTIFLSSLALIFCGFYLGLETIYGVLIGIAIALALSFLLLIIKKSPNIFDFLSNIFKFLAIGFLIANILTVLLYSQIASNILFAIGCLCIITYTVLSMCLKSKYDKIAYFVGMYFAIVCVIF